MDYKLTDNREEGATTTVSQSFDYDEENRVARITENYHSTDEYSYKDNGTEIYTFDYTIANEVSVRTTDEAERLLYKISAKTDAKGRITETSSYDYDNGTPRLEGQETYTYTPEGRLSSLLSKYSYSSSSGLNQYSENKFYYTDGLFRDAHATNHTNVGQTPQPACPDSDYMLRHPVLCAKDHLPVYETDNYIRPNIYATPHHDNIQSES